MRKRVAIKVARRWFKNERWVAIPLFLKAKRRLRREHQQGAWVRTIAMDTRYDHFDKWFAQRYG